MPTALIIDPDGDVRALIRRVLVAEGWAVREAGHGRAVPAMLAAGDLDLIITELYMDDVCGLGLLRLVRPHDTGIPVVVTTTDGFSDGIDYLRVATLMGAGGTLRKPFRPRDLLSVVHACVLRQPAITSA